MINILRLEPWLSQHFELLAASPFLVIPFAQLLRRTHQERKAENLLAKAVRANMNEPLTLHPEIDPALCAGCGACTRVCPEGDILKLINHQAVLVSPTQCVGHGECEKACPTGAISLVFGTRTRGMDIPRISSDFETNVEGLYIAGELGGMGLIRNAIKQGALAAKHALGSLPSSTPETDTDVLVVGAGPAGLAAALVAIERKRRYICIEQSGFGGTVYNFPRQKVVMSHPASLPLVGTMRFPRNKVSKEELLAYWNGVRQKTGLKIRDHTKFEGLEKKDGVFRVRTNHGAITAKKVILCMGVRGSPRRLGLPNEELPKVAYNLLDPEQYQHQDVAIVGGGNAAVEAAQYLAHESYGNRVKLIVRGPTFDRCNEENQAIITEMAQQGRLEIWYNSVVRAIEPDQILVATDEGEKQIANHFLFIFVGAEMPHKFLMSLGIRIDKKFGEPLARPSLRPKLANCSL